MSYKIDITPELEAKIRYIAELGLHAAIADIQKHLGVDSGDVAAYYFNGNPAEPFIIDHLRGYIVTEINMTHNFGNKDDGSKMMAKFDALEVLHTGEVRPKKV